MRREKFGRRLLEITSPLEHTGNEPMSHQPEDD
jgi:hypothetical protein